MERKFKYPDVYTNVEKKAYAEYLIGRFDGIVNAANVIDEMLKVAPEGSLVHDLKKTRELIFELK